MKKQTLSQHLVADYNYWTGEEIELLKKAYKVFPIQYPESLIIKHEKSGCHTKAYRLGLTKGIRNPGVDLSHLSETDKSYMAGIIDGEGSIIMNYNKPKTNPAVQVANTDKALMDWIKEKFTVTGLSVVYRNRHNPKWKDVYQLYIQGILNVYAVLTAIEPYLIIKKDKAKKAIDFLKQKYNL
jgi:hypothetical protein